MPASNRDTSIAGHTALVTGGARGLGAQTASALAAAGARVFVVDLQEPTGPTPPGITTLKGDVTQQGDMERVVEQVVGDSDRLDIVVANAGVAARGATLQATAPDAIDQLFAVNVNGVLNTVRAGLPALIESSGRLVVVSSVFAYLNGAGTIPYAMSKAAVEQLGRGLRVELASHGVSVTTAYFAMLNTDMIRQSIDEDPVAAALLDSLPAVLAKRLDADIAARAIVDALRRRKPRVVRPRRWSAVASLRGVLGPAIDARLVADDNVQRLLADLAARTGENFLTS